MRAAHWPLAVVLLTLVSLFSACGDSDDRQHVSTPTATALPPATPTATPDAAALACRNSGGVTASRQCCVSAGDFPNTCRLGACGCAPSASREAIVCQCASGCFDGTGCVER
jgi:hypothetical protein